MQRGSVPVLASSNLPAGGSGNSEHSADHYKNNAHRPEYSNFRDKTDDQENDSEKDHVVASF